MSLSGKGAFPIGKVVSLSSKEALLSGEMVMAIELASRVLAKRRGTAGTRDSGPAGRDLDPRCRNVSGVSWVLGASTCCGIGVPRSGLRPPVHPVNLVTPV